MPSKGDDLDAAIASEITEHRSNVKCVFTPKGSPHPSTASVCFRGIFDNAFLDNDNGRADKQPIVNYQDSLIPGALVGGTLSVSGRGDYSVVELEPSGRGRTIMMLMKISA